MHLQSPKKQNQPLFQYISKFKPTDKETDDNHLRPALESDHKATVRPDHTEKTSLLPFYSGPGSIRQGFDLELASGLGDKLTGQMSLNRLGC